MARSAPGTPSVNEASRAGATAAGALSGRLVHGTGGALGVVLAIIALAVALGVGSMTLPVSPLLALSALTLWLARQGKGAWSKGAAEVLLPVTIGLALLVIVLFTFNVRGRYIPDAELRAAEMHLIRLRLQLADLLSLPRLALVLAALVVLGRAFRNPHLVSGFVKLRRVLSAAVIVLTTVLSFSFFSQLPIAGWADAEQARRVEQSNGLVVQYQLQLRREDGVVAGKLAVRQMQQAVEELSVSERSSLTTLLNAIDRGAAHVPVGPAVGIFQPEPRPGKIHLAPAAPPAGQPAVQGGRDLRDETGRSFARSQLAAAGLARTGGTVSQASDEAEQQAARRRLAAQRVEHEPETLAELDAQDRLLAAQTEELKRQEARTRSEAAELSQGMEALKQIVTAALSLATPELGGLAGTFMEELVSGCAEHEFDAVAAARATSAGERSAPVDVRLGGVSLSQIARRLLQPSLPGRAAGALTSADADAEVGRRVQVEAADLSRAEAAARERARDAPADEMLRQALKLEESARKSGIDVEELLREKPLEAARARERTELKK